jgi:ornithine cyclodeaminase
MKVRTLSGNDVEVLLSMDECIDVVGRALAALSNDESVNPLRSLVRFPSGAGLLGLMPAVTGSPPISGIKVLTVMPGNEGTPYDSHQGAVMLFELEHGRPLAIVDASAITAIRTAAASGVATRLLALEGADRLAILGSGVQARTHLDAMRVVRPVTAAVVYSRSEDHARAFATEHSDRCGIPIDVALSVREAVEGADLICTTTSAREPVLYGEWLSSGAHINAVGACFPAARELDTHAVARSRLFVDRRESAFNEAGDFLIPKAEGAIDDDHIVGEIGELVSGRIEGRTAPDQITLFKSLGVAVEDLVAAYHAYQKALDTDRGCEIDL